MLSLNKCQKCGGDIKIDEALGAGVCKYCGTDQKFSQNKCQMCGGEIEIDKKSGLIVCKYCGTKQELSDQDINLLKNEAKTESASFQKSNNKSKIIIIISSIVLILIVSIAIVTAYNNHKVITDAYNNGVKVTDSNNSKIKITDANMTTDIDSQGKPIDTIASYKTSAAKFTVSAIIRNAPNNTKITFVWYYGGSKITSAELDSGTIPDRYIYGYLTNTKAWPEGNYSVEIYTADNSSPSSIVHFTVIK